MSRRSSTMLYSEKPEIGYEVHTNSQNSTWIWIQKKRAFMRTQMSMKRFHLTVISLVAFDLAVVMVELIVALLTAGCTTEDLYHLLLELLAANPDVDASEFACSLIPSNSRDILENSMFGLNLSLLSIFAIEVLASVIAWGPVAYFKSWVSLLDGFVVYTTLILDIYFHFSDSPSAKSPIALVILRLWKVFRAVHAISHAMQMHWEQVMEVAERSHHEMRKEKKMETSRLAFYRATIKRLTGEDVDQELVEEFVKSEMAEDGDESLFSEKREELVRRGSDMSIMNMKSVGDESSSSDSKSGEEEVKEVDYLPRL